MINRPKFFSAIKPKLFKKLTVSQVEGMEFTITEWESRPELIDLRWLAYMLATKYWETDKTMQPIEEYGKGKGRPYGSRIKRSGVHYNLPNKLYYGRGDVQLTWYENYELMGRLLGVDLLNHPESALMPPIAAKIMFEGMLKGASSFGDFTGKCLEMYFNATTDDPVNARKIINGLDQAKKISEIHKVFLIALN